MCVGGVCPCRNYRRMIRFLVRNKVTWESPVSKAMMIMLDTGLIYALFFVRALLPPTVLVHTPVVLTHPDRSQLAEGVLNATDVNSFLAGHPARAFALQIYQYQTSAIVVRPPPFSLSLS